MEINVGVIGASMIPLRRINEASFFKAAISRCWWTRIVHPSQPSHTVSNIEPDEDSKIKILRMTFDGHSDGTTHIESMEIRKARQSKEERKIPVNEV
jgi:hypothetical protein